MSTKTKEEWQTELTAAQESLNSFVRQAREDGYNVVITQITNAPLNPESYVLIEVYQK